MTKRGGQRVRRQPSELDEFLRPFPDEVRDIALGLRGAVFQVMPNAHEVLWDATNAVSLVFTPTTRWQDGVVHVAVYAKHVNLGFNQGAALPDPRRILQGTGARIRHVTVRSVDEVGAAWVGEYVRAAMAYAGVLPSAGDGGTTVRSSAGRKRRPT
jgi:hypothetical protein